MKPPQYVIYHELIHTARPFMRHVLGVERAWLMQCREKIGRATASNLSGGHRFEVSHTPTAAWSASSSISGTESADHGG
jgi:hypothetical protein